MRLQFFKKFDVNYLLVTLRHAINSGNRDTVIGNFSRRKCCGQIIYVEKDLKKVKMQDIRLTGNQSMFINTSLSPYYPMLWSKCKRLHELRNVTNCYISCDTIKVKIIGNSLITITDMKDFTKHFPVVDLLASSLI